MGIFECHNHDDVIKWKHFARYWPFVRGIHRSPVNSPHKGQWPGALIFSLICVCISGWVSNHEAGDLRRYPAHYDVSVMISLSYCVGCILCRSFPFACANICWWLHKLRISTPYQRIICIVMNRFIHHQSLHIEWKTDIRRMKMQIRKL